MALVRAVEWRILSGDILDWFRTAMGQKTAITKTLRGNFGPVLAREREVVKTEAITALLIRPIAILPANIGDPIRPFALGLWNDIRPLLRPDISVSALRKAMATYVHSRSYQIAVARADSLRHDINGKPVEPVSDADRLDAQKKYEAFKARDESHKSKPASPLRHKDRSYPNSSSQAEGKPAIDDDAAARRRALLSRDRSITKMNR